MKKIIAAAVLAAAPLPSSAQHAGLSQAAAAAAAAVKADPSRQAHVWAVEERLVAAALDEMAFGALEHAQSVLRAVRTHRGALRVSDERLRAAEEAVGRARALKDRLAAAGVITADPERPRFSYFGKDPGAELAALVRSYREETSRVEQDPDYRAVLKAAKLGGKSCIELDDERFDLCNAVRDAQVVYEVRWHLYQRAVYGPRGLSAALAEAVQANGGAFNGRWLERPAP